ncbi:MAG: 50S ribosomal protein L25 [Chloroflexota bacterium]|nr:50S ribosomal protein L25 [Chloroflexota bacterium]
MSDLVLNAERRTLLGKQVKQLRRVGRVPGIVYGPVSPETVPVTVDRREFDRFYQVTGHSTLFTLKWNDGEHSVFIREVQQDPIRRAPLHIDFFAPNLLKLLRTSVPIVLHHANPDAEGVMTQIRSEVEVEGLPTDIPHQIDADISHLVAVGDSLRVSDLTLPENLTIVTDSEELLVHLAAETVPEPEEVEEEGDEEAEGAEAEAAEGDATASERSSSTADVE